MIIRSANKWDLEQIIVMLKHFRNQSPVELLKNVNDEEYINKIFHEILQGRGIALVVESDSVVGMILSYIAPNIWDPKILVLNELCYWVEPEYRNTTAGYRLLREYNKLAKELIEEKRIHLFTMNKMINSPDLDYGRFGYKKIEETWIGQ